MNKYLAGAVLTFGLLISPLTASAAGLTNSQIQAILSLLTSFGADAATITNVQMSLNGGTPSNSGQSWCHTFNTDMTVGSGGDDVVALNQALQSVNIDTTGNTSNFDENNAGDVVSFQAHYGIRQTGYVGPVTRAKLNTLYGCHGNQSSVSPSSPATMLSPTPVDNDHISTASSMVVITSISPSTGSLGTTVNLYGKNLSPRGNLTIQFLRNGIVVEGISGSIVSADMDGTSAQFTIGPALAASLNSGTYQVRAISNGYQSNTVDFTTTTFVTTVQPPATTAPTANISATPSVINPGQSSTITFSSTNAAVCSGLNITTGPTRGAVVVYPTQTTTYTMNCFERASMSDSGRYAVANATVTVNSPFTITWPSSGNETLYFGATYTATWTGSESGVSSYQVNLRDVGTGLQYSLGTASVSNGSFTFIVPTNLPENHGPYQLIFSGPAATGASSGLFSIGYRQV